MSRFIDAYQGACPTCDGDGSDDAPFDANCPAAWAHRFIESRGGVTSHDMAASRAFRNIGLASSPRGAHPK